MRNGTCWKAYRPDLSKHYAIHCTVQQQEIIPDKCQEFAHLHSQHDHVRQETEVVPIGQEVDQTVYDEFV